MSRRQRHRDSVKILLEILERASKPIRTTKLTNLCNLSHTLAMKMTAFLIESGFLKKLSSAESRGRFTKKDGRLTHLYLTTKKGLQLLELIQGSALNELFGYGKEATE